MRTILLHLYKLMLRLYPCRFYEVFGVEMATVFAEKVENTSSNRALLAAFWRELRHWPGICLREHWAAQQAHLDFPVYEKMSWRETVVAVGPYLFVVLLLAASFLISLVIENGSFNFASRALFNRLMNGSIVVIFTIMLLVAWRQRWPGWSASWAGLATFIVFYIYLPQLLFQSTFTSLVLLPLMLLGIFYWFVGRWPQTGVIVLLSPIGFTWLLHLEFVPEHAKLIIFLMTWGWLAIVSALMMQLGNGRWNAWFLGLAGLVIGLLSSFAGQYWVSVPRDGSLTRLMENFLSEFVPMLLPLVVILLLHALRRWAVENGRSALRSYRFLFLGILITFIAARPEVYLFLPDNLMIYQARAAIGQTAVLLLGLLVIVWTGLALRYRDHVPQPDGSEQLGLLITLVALFPIIYQAEPISMLLQEIPVIHAWALPNNFAIYETVRLSSRVVGLIWLVLAAWVLSRILQQLSPSMPSEITAVSTPKQLSN